MESDRFPAAPGRSGGKGVFFAWLVGICWFRWFFSGGDGRWRRAGLGIWVLDRGIDMFGVLKDGILAI